MLFPSRIKRIIFCFVYSENHHPYYVYPSLEEEILQPYIVDVDSISSSQPVSKDESNIPILLESDHPFDFVKIEIDSKPIESSIPFGITDEPDHQPVQPTSFQIKIRTKMFKPLKLPALLHPYPDNCYEYIPWFSGENQALDERHLESFLDFIDRFQIVHEDVIMRYFAKTLIRDTAVWFKSLRTDSIGSWIEFSNVFIKYWGDHKSPDLYLADFYALKREHGESLPVFNRRFCSIFHDMPLEIHPLETTAMIYYVMGLHSELDLLLLERKSSSLSVLFEDALEVEENICASRRTPEQVEFENHCLLGPAECQLSTNFEQEDNDYGAVLEQQQATRIISDCESDSSTLVEFSRDRYSSKDYD
jgi:hypothetical protein